jgi:hypothetical protein
LEGENDLFRSVLVKKVVNKPNMKLECVPKFCYLGDTLGAGGGADKAAIELWCDVLVQGAITHPYSLSLQLVAHPIS